MRSFTVDVLGRCGPQHMVVELALSEVRERLVMSLVAEDSESWVEAIFATNRRYAGKLRDSAFELVPLWRNRRFRPTLTGSFEDLQDGTTRIQFQLHSDPIMVVPLVLAPFLYVPILLAYFLIDTTKIPLVFFVVALPILFVIGGVITTLTARHESGHLLRFFVDLFRVERVA